MKVKNFNVESDRSMKSRIGFGWTCQKFWISKVKKKKLKLKLKETWETKFSIFQLSFFALKTLSKAWQREKPKTPFILNPIAKNKDQGVFETILQIFLSQSARGNMLVQYSELISPFSF